MHLLIRLFCSIALAFSIASLAYSFEPQDTNQSGFQLKIISEDTQDSSSFIFIRFDEIKSLPIHSIQLPDHKTNEIITWEGAYLREVVQKFLDIAWEKIDRLIIKAPDGYSSVVSGIRMKQAGTALCAFGMQNKVWPKKFGYMRVIFPELHEMHWINNPSEVELILKKESQDDRTWKFVFLDSPVFHSTQNKKADETTEWSVNDILTAIGCANQGFAIFTSDGQVREYLFDEIGQKMKFAADSSGYLKIRGERIPIGFRLRKIFFFYSENVGVFTKSLTPEEQLLWQRLFASIHQPTIEGLPARQVFVILASGERIPSANFEQYHANEISLYQLFQMEKDERNHLIGFEVIW